MIPHIALMLWLKSFTEKIMCGGLVLYALRYKQSVAVKYANGTFELIATGDLPKKIK